MPSQEHGQPQKHPPYIDESLVIDTRLKEIERRQEEEKKEEREYKKRQLRFNKLMTLFTFLLFLVSAISDIFLWQYVALTKISADAATGSLKQNTDAFKIDERARLRMIVGEHGWHAAMKEHPLLANYRFTNIGKTEGEIVAIDKHVALVPSVPEARALQFSPMPPSAEVGVVSPGEDKLVTVFDYSIPPSRAKEVEDGKSLIASWGCIGYEEIFGDVHWVDFCNVRQPPPNQGAFASCRYRCQRP